MIEGRPRSAIRSETAGGRGVARARGLLSAAALLVPSAACDLGVATVQGTQGPKVRLVATNVGRTKPLPADGVIEASFDRPLDPRTVLRQSIIVVDGNGRVPVSPLVAYDPVTKVISLSSPEPGRGAWLEPDQYYTLRLLAADSDAGTTGLQAIDGAPLDPAFNAPIGFRTTAAAGPPPPEPTVRFCDDVLPLLRAHCSGAPCHGAGSTPALSHAPAVGLLLDSPEGVARTAVGRVAVGSNTGPRAGGVALAPPFFGEDMAIIRRGSAGASFLLYKVLMSAPAPGDGGAPPPRCGSGGAPVDVPPPLVSYARWTAADRETLGALISGQPMPYPGPMGTMASALAPLAEGDLFRLRAWIAQGAPVDACAPCGP